MPTLCELTNPQRIRKREQTKQLNIKEVPRLQTKTLVLIYRGSLSKFYLMIYSNVEWIRWYRKSIRPTCSPCTIYHFSLTSLHEKPCVTSCLLKQGHIPWTHNVDTSLFCHTVVLRALPNCCPCSVCHFFQDPLHQESPVPPSTSKSQNYTDANVSTETFYSFWVLPIFISCLKYLYNYHVCKRYY